MGRWVGSLPLARAYPNAFSMDSLEFGSLPLARALLDPFAAGEQLERVTPARAGFTGRQPADHDKSPSHSRSRGLYYRAQLYCTSESGSLPLARALPSLTWSF